MKVQKFAIATAVLAAAAIPASATAGGGNNDPEKAEVKVTIEVTQDNTTPNDDVFEGKVKSDRKACSKAGRVINLYGGRRARGLDRVNADGEYTMEVSNPHQGVFPYKAKIDRNDKCKTGKSKGVSPGSS